MLISALKKLFGLGNDDLSQYNRNEKSDNQRPVDDLCNKIVDQQYIDNLHLGRSWILPQMVDASFNSRGEFDEKRYFEYIASLDYEKCWRILLRNYKAIITLSNKQEQEALAIRQGWWTKDVAVAMAKYDLSLLVKHVKSCEVLTECSGGPYICLPYLRNRKNKFDKMFFVNTPNPESKYNKENSKTVQDLYAYFNDMIEDIASANSPVALYKALTHYNAHRCATETHVSKHNWPNEFVNAFAGDGAQSAMNTMVKILNLRYNDSRELKMTRDECLADISKKADDTNYNGLEMLEYCKQKFFDKSVGGVFDYKSYL